MRLMKFLPIVILFAAALLGGYLFLFYKSGLHHQSAHKDVYYCPMHTYYTSDRPGNCPICNMKLVKRVQLEDSGHQHSVTQNSPLPTDYASVDLSSAQQQLMGIKTVEAKRRPLIKTVHAYGTVVHETELYQVQSEFIDSYIEYINAYRDYKRVIDRRRGWETHRDLQVKLLEAEHKLLLLGLSHEQISVLQRIDRQQIWDQPELMFFKSENNYWIIARLFEDDLGYVEALQTARVELLAYRETFDGTVRSVGGAIDPETRTVRVLIEPNTPQAGLTIGMLVDVSITAELGEQLAVPREAVMDLGTRRIVFVAKDHGMFMPREVEIGAQGDGYWAVTKGLIQGERVVVDGNFLLDSESRLRASAANPQEGGSHVH